MNCGPSSKLWLASLLATSLLAATSAIAGESTAAPEIIVGARQSGTDSPVTPQNTQSLSAAASSDQPRVIPLLGPGVLNSNEATTSAAPAALDSQSPPPPLASANVSLAPALTKSYAGYGATGWRPADPNLAVGTQRIIQVGNSSIRLTDRNNAAVAGGVQTTLNSLFGTPIAGQQQFDPVCQFDHFTGRFIYLGLVRNSGSTDGYYILAVSKDAFPSLSASSWFIYYLRNDIDFPSTDTNNWGDYPKLGFDSAYIYITTNQFSPADSFQYAKIRVYEKAQLYNGLPVSGFEFNDVRDAANNRVFTICPAVTFGYPGIEYLAACQYGSASTVTLFKIATSNVTLTRADIAVNAYSNPSDAVQKGTTTTIDTGDDRLLNAVYQNGRLYTCHTVANGTTASSAAYLGFNTLNNTKTLDVRYSSSGYFYSYPAVGVGRNGHLGTVFNFSTSTRFAGIAYTQLNTSTQAFQGASTLKEGVGTYTREWAHIPKTAGATTTASAVTSLIPMPSGSMPCMQRAETTGGRGSEQRS
jgi:hypothetical protein